MNNFWLKRKDWLLTLDERAIFETYFLEYWENNRNDNEVNYYEKFLSIIRLNFSQERYEDFIASSICGNWLFVWSLVCCQATSDIINLDILNAVDCLFVPK